MEKTNKCNVQYVCWGSVHTCEFAEPKDATRTCDFFEEGLCTCKEAQKEAVE